jgi:hypothetical protein
MPAIAVYAAILICSFLAHPGVSARWRQTAWRVLTTLALMAAAAGLWFTALMLFAVEGLCPFCLVTHACGLTIAVLVILHGRSQVDQEAGTAWMAVLQSSARPKSQTQPTSSSAPLPASGASREPSGIGARSGQTYRRAAEPSRIAISWSAGATALAGVSALILGQLLFPAKEYRIRELADVVEDTPIEEGAYLVQKPAIDSSPSPPGVSSENTGRNRTAPDEEPTSHASGPDVAQPPGTGQTETTELGPGSPPAIGDGGWPPRTPIAIRGGRVVLERKHHPLIGSPGAKHLVVKAFDYTCRHCQKVHHHLEEARRQYGDRLAVVLLPIPLNTRCNEYVAYNHPDHNWACEYAELAIAVWMADPSVFEEFHCWLLATPRPPVLAEANRQASRLTGEQRLAEAQASSELKERMRDYIEFFNNSGEGSLPKVFAGKYVIEWKSQDTEEFCVELEKILGPSPEHP